MDKISAMNLLVYELKTCGEALLSISESLSGMIQIDDLQCEMENPKSKPQLPEQNPITLKEVRAILAQKSRAGHTSEVRTLLERHGAEKLSEIDPSEYPSLLQEAQVLGNG